MRRATKISISAASLLFALLGGAWTYYVATSLAHAYDLIECSKGRVRMIPKALCRGYLFEAGISGTDAAEIVHDGSLFHVVATAEAHDQAPLLAVLVSSGVDINARDGRLGLTPLHAAVLGNDALAASLLLQHGANPDFKDEQHRLTPLELALRLKEKSPDPDREAIIALLRHAARSP